MTDAGWNGPVRRGAPLRIEGGPGAGKSALVAARWRPYDRGRGTTTLGGADIPTVTQDCLRRRTATDTQEAAMFASPSRDGSLPARPDGDAAAVARRAGGSLHTETAE